MRYAVKFTPADGSATPIYVRSLDDPRKVAVYTDRGLAERMAAIYHKAEVVAYVYQPGE